MLQTCVSNRRASCAHAAPTTLQAARRRQRVAPRLRRRPKRQRTHGSGQRGRSFLGYGGSLRGAVLRAWRSARRGHSKQRRCSDETWAHSAALAQRPAKARKPRAPVAPLASDRPRSSYSRRPSEPRPARAFPWVSMATARAFPRQLLKGFLLTHLRPPLEDLLPRHLRPRVVSDERRATRSPATNALVWRSTDTATVRPTRSGTSQDASDKDFTLTGSQLRRGATRAFCSTCLTVGRARARRRWASSTR